MKLSKKTFSIIIGFTAVALIGLVVIQCYLLLNSMELKKQAFQQNVTAALGIVVSKLETQEALHKVMEVTLNLDGTADTDFKMIRRIGTDSSLAHFLKDGKLDIPFQVSPADDRDTTSLVYYLKSPRQVHIEVLDSLDGAGDVVREESRTGKQKVASGHKAGKLRNKHFNFMSDSAAVFVGVRNTSKTGFDYSYTATSGKKVLVDKVVKQLTEINRRPLADRIDPDVLDSLLTDAMHARGIATDFYYGVLSGARSDSLILGNSSKFAKDIAASTYQALLFPNDVFVGSNTLRVYFPDEQLYFFKQIAFSVVISFMLIAGVVVCFVYTIRTLIRQRDFSIRLTGFINNMVHEFKTPISTIALASESLSNSRIISPNKKLSRYSRIIHEENTRMRHQVDKILQMAVLEEGTFEINRSQIDLHALIEDAVQKVRLQVEGRKGHISTELGAASSIIQADPLHTANIIHNLLDNAIKYTKKIPEIMVSTEMNEHQISIKIQDNGIGLTPEQCLIVFEKYYRVPTGNVHDVKGFGLGLSYVKLMIEAHGGAIEIQSKPGLGTTVKLALPLITK